MRNTLNVWEVVASISTLITAVVAFYSARESAKSASESKRAAQANFMPIIEPLRINPLQSAKDHLYEFHFKNSGAGLALNTKIQIPELGFDETLLSLKSGETGVVQTINSSGSLDYWKKLAKDELKFEVSYLDIFGNHIKTIGSAKVAAHPYEMVCEWTLSYTNF